MWEELTELIGRVSNGDDFITVFFPHVSNFELDSGRICGNCIFRDTSRNLVVTVSF